MILPGSTTHHFDAGQRYVLLKPDTTYPWPEDGMTLHASSGSNFAPAGYYMLVVRTDHGILSIAKWVRPTH